MKFSLPGKAGRYSSRRRPPAPAASPPIPSRRQYQTTDTARESPTASRTRNSVGPKVPQRKVKHAKRISRQIRLDREQQKRNQQPNRNRRMHISRECQPAHHRYSADGINDVVDIKSVTRSLLLSHASQGTVQTVAEPVHRETDNGRKQHPAIPGGEGIANSGRDLSNEADGGQVVGIDPSRHASGHPDERAFLRRRQKTPMPEQPAGTRR